MNVKVELSYEEIQILIQCIHSLNFSGQHVVPVGLLTHRLQTELSKIEQKVQQKNEQAK